MYSILYPDILIKDNFKYEKLIAADKCQLIKYDAKTSKEIPEEVWNKADALITGLYMKIDESVIQKLKSCKIITKMGVGYDLILGQTKIEVKTEKNIIKRDYNTKSIQLKKHI